MKNSEKSSSNNNNNNNINNVTSNSQKELLAKVTEAAKKLTTKGEDITGEAVVKQLGGAPWSYDTSKVTAESGKVYTRRYIQHNGVDVIRIDNVGKLLEGYEPSKRGRRAVAPKTKVQELNCIIDNLCNFAAEVEGEAHEAEAFKKLVTEAPFIVNLTTAAEAIDKAAAEAAEAEAARIAAIEEQKKIIEGLAKLPHLIPQYIEGIIDNNTFVYDICFDQYLSPEQKEKYKPAEAEADNEPAEAAEGAKVEATDKATTANGKGRKTA